jgi:hypothetical protein
MRWNGNALISHKKQKSTRRIQMKRRKLVTGGVILALSLFSSASCLADDDTALEVIYHLFGPKDSVKEVKEIEALTGASREQQRKADAEEKRLSDEQLAKQAEYKRKDDVASKQKKDEFESWSLNKVPRESDFRRWRAEHPMASDQGKKATWEFIDNVTGNNNGAGGETSNQPNNARDQARDGAWEAAKAAASDVRGSVRSTIDGMKCSDGH